MSNTFNLGAGISGLGGGGLGGGGGFNPLAGYNPGAGFSGGGMGGQQPRLGPMMGGMSPAMGAAQMSPAQGGVGRLPGLGAMMGGGGGGFGQGGPAINPLAGYNLGGSQPNFGSGAARLWNTNNLPGGGLPNQAPPTWQPPPAAKPAANPNAVAPLTPAQSQVANAIATMQPGNFGGGGGTEGRGGGSQTGGGQAPDYAFTKPQDAIAYKPSTDPKNPFQMPPDQMHTYLQPVMNPQDPANPTYYWTSQPANMSPFGTEGWGNNNNNPYSGGGRGNSAANFGAPGGAGPGAW